MSKYKMLSFSEMPQALINEIAQSLQRSTVALIKIFVGDNGQNNATHIGSGTLISIGEIYGILTAQHVINELSNGCHLGLTIGREGQEVNFSIPKTYLNIIDVGIPKEEEYGPDLSFVFIPPVHVSTIKATKYFFPILIDQERALKDSTPKEGVWCICGSPEVMTLEETSEQFNKVLSFCNYCGIGGIPNYFHKNGYDYCEIAVDYRQSNNIPQKFNGISGGGLWQIVLESEKILKPKSYTFSGVVYWQSPKEDDFRNLMEKSNKHRTNSVVAIARQESIFENA
jgi:hypothetical protein